MDSYSLVLHFFSFVLFFYYVAINFHIFIFLDNNICPSEEGGVRGEVEYAGDGGIDEGRVDPVCMSSLFSPRYVEILLCT